MSKNKEKSLNSLSSLAEKFPDEKSCIDFLIKVRWNSKPVCPHCGSDRKTYIINNGKILKCADCRKPFTVKLGTIFEDSPISLRTWFFAIFIITGHKKGISSLQLSRDIEVTQKTAWFMLHRIRYAIKTKSFNKPFNGIIEADETYIGGKHKGKRGRGSENKTAVFGMIERHGEVRVSPVKRVDAKTLKTIIRENVSKDSTIMTDEWTAYNRLSEEYKHRIINHNQKIYVDGEIHVNNIENFWGLLKKGIVGIYHHVSGEHLRRYCDEFQFRYNTRKIKDSERFVKTLSKLNGRLTYKELIN